MLRTIPLIRCARLVVVPLAAALIAGAAGCSALAGPEDSVTKPADYVQFVGVGRGYTGDGPGVTKVPKGVGLLAGPYFSIKLYSVLVTQTLRGDDAAAAGEHRTVRAAAGHEFVVATMDPDDRYNGPYGYNGPHGSDTSAVVIVGDREVTLAKVPNQGDVITASAPVGAPVRLRITDLGRSQTLDLRDGSRGDDAITGYYRPMWQETSYQYKETGTLAYGARSTHPTVAVAVSGVTLQPWVPGVGWAAPEHAWLELEPPLISCTDMSEYFVFRLDTDQTFTVTLPDGRKVAALRKMFDRCANVLDKVLFDVPASFSTGTLTVTPNGRLLAYAAANSAVEIGWTTAPARRDMAISIPT